MTLYEFNSSLETFVMDLKESGDIAGYAKAVVDLINDFRSAAMQKSKEELINDMMNFVTSVRSTK